MSEPLGGTISPVSTPLSSMECFSICQPVLNPDWVCPGSCFIKCPDVCKVPLSPPPPPPFYVHGDAQKHVISASMSIGASVLGAVLFLGVFCIVSRSYCRRQGNQWMRRAASGPTNEGPELDHPIWHIHTVGLQQSVIDSIAVFKYEKGGGGLVEGGAECSVCLNEFRDGETLRLLPKCSHAFHLPCIDTWLRSHKNCPVCRAPVVNASFDGRVDLLVPLSSDLSSLGEARIGNSGSGSGSGGEGQDSISSDHIHFRSDLVEHGEDVEAAIHPVRRSVSLDSSSALAIVSHAVRGKQPGNLDGTKQSKHSRAKHLDKRGSTGSLSFRKLMMDSSIGKSLQMGPISMKRSFSSRGKTLSSSFSRGESGRRDSILPL